MGRGLLMPRLTMAAAAMEATAVAMEATAVAMEATATARGPLMLTTAAATVVAMEVMAVTAAAMATASKSTKDETSPPLTSESRDLTLNPFLRISISYIMF